MKTNRLIIKYSIAFLVVAVVLAAFVFGAQVLSDNLQQVPAQAGEDVNSNILRQFLAVAVMFMMGLLVLLPFKHRLGMTQVMLLAYLLGVVLFDLISILLLSVSVYYSLATVMAAYGVLVAVWYVVCIKKEKSVFAFSKEETLKLLFWSAVILAVGFVLSQSRITILTYDSVQYNLLGKVYAAEHYYVDYATFQMSWLMPVFTLLSSAAVFFGFDIPYALQNMFTLSAAVLFGYLLFSEARGYGFVRKKAVWVSLLGTLLLVTSFFYVFLGITQVTNIFAGIALMFLMIYLYRYSQNNKTIDLVISLVFMLTFCFTRVEGPLMSAFILGYLAHQKLPAKPLSTYTLVVTGVVLLNYISFYAHAGLDFSSDFLSPERSALSVALLATVAIYVVAKEKWFVDKTKLLGRIYFVAVLLFALGASALDITKFINNIRVTYLNMFAEGFWVTGWFGAILLSCFALFMTKKQNTFMEGFIPIYLLVMLTIFAFRTTYLHLNWSDSGNRLLMHIYPLVMFVLADNLLSIFKPKLGE